MYSKKIIAILKEKEIGIGDEIGVVSEGGAFHGLLMPRPTLGDRDILVVKMSNGYNVGVKPESIELIKKAEKYKKPEKAKPEPLKKGDISIIGCGGTIASRLEYKTGAVYPSITASELRISFPELNKWPIHSRQIFSLFSEDMNSKHWKLLADAVEKDIKEGAKGIVVLHGTDTMSYTSSALSFMLQNLPVPIVFVGSQRSSDRPSSENKINLMNSLYAATKDVGEVMVCMHAGTNDDYCYLHRGNRVRKMHTSKREAFKSINSRPLFAIDHRSKRFEQLSGCKKRSSKGLAAKKKINDNVALVYVHPNIKPDFISKLDSYDGVVIAGTGLGHAPMNPFSDKSVLSIQKPIRELISSDIPVVMSSQCISGRVCMRVYTTGRMLKDIGVIGDGADWTPETAYVKLCWALGQTKKMNEVSQLMMTDIAGEMNKRSIMEEY